MTTEAEPTWSIPLAAGRVTVPATIQGVRAALPPDRAEDFDAEVPRTPGPDLLYFLLDALVESVLTPVGTPQDREVIARLRTGDFAGVLDERHEPVHVGFAPRDPEAGEPSPQWTASTGPFPATIEGIRATLAPDQRPAFDRDIATTPAQHLAHATVRWGYPAEDRAREDELIARLREGDFTGAVPAPPTEDGEQRGTGAA
ncbi:hypothetical protein ACFVIM_08745 [Streptomyces sp. NPDC057638]|uniref:hypothetical protein n=1 Tax=Streptomyces sp. NPDC057638 TaxID=3346190 RepID=UPI003691ADFC